MLGLFQKLTERMDANEDLGLDKLFSEEVLGIIMTEPIGIDRALYDINVEAELATLSTEQRKEEELDEPTEPAQSSLPNSKRMKQSVCRPLITAGAVYSLDSDICIR